MKYSFSDATTKTFFSGGQCSLMTDQTPFQLTRAGYAPAPCQEKRRLRYIYIYIYKFKS
jgi:hypothetical protein